MLLQRGVVDTLIYPLGGLKPCMDAMRTLRKRQTRGRRLSDAVGEKLEYYSLIRLPYQSLTHTDRAVVAYVSPRLWVVWRKGRREGRSLGEIRVGSNPTVPTIK